MEQRSIIVWGLACVAWWLPLKASLPTSVPRSTALTELKDDGVRRTASVLGGKQAVEALEAAEAMTVLEMAEKGVAMPQAEAPSPLAATAGGYRSRGAELWGVVRLTMADGVLRRLLHDEKYCIVSAVFSALFPDDFDRVSSGSAQAQWLGEMP